MKNRLFCKSGMIWALDLDDFTDHCGEGVHPLLTTLQSVLAPPTSDLDSSPANEIPTNVLPQNTNSEVLEETTHGAVEDHSSNIVLNTKVEENGDFKVVCYCKSNQS